MIERPTGGIVIVEIEPGEDSGIWLRDGIRFGKGVTLSGDSVIPEYSGYDFSDMLKRPFDHQFTDMFLEYDEAGLVMRVREDTEIMDIWPTFVPENQIFVSPNQWSPGHTLPLILGHEYVIRTWDGHYAKFIVTSLSRSRVVFDWAYQYGNADDAEVTASMQLYPQGNKFDR